MAAGVTNAAPMGGGLEIIAQGAVTTSQKTAVFNAANLPGDMGVLFVASRHSGGWSSGAFIITKQPLGSSTDTTGYYLSDQSGFEICYIRTDSATELIWSVESGFGSDANPVYWMVMA